MSRIIYPEWMTEDQKACYQFACYLFGGQNHLHGTIKPDHSGVGFSIRVRFCSNHFATFDYSWLTKAVIVAHEQAIRFGIDPSSQGALNLHFTKRTRDGYMTTSHPTLDEVVPWIRQDFDRFSNS